MIAYWRTSLQLPVSSETFQFSSLGTSKPLQYESVTCAINYHQWVDTIARLDQETNCRPLTFSANGTFSGFGDGRSSIDDH